MREALFLQLVLAKNDYAVQIVTNLAQKVDPKRFCTLDIIQKTGHPTSRGTYSLLHLKSFGTRIREVQTEVPISSDYRIGISRSNLVIEMYLSPNCALTAVV